jgi:sugar lactone lactonase YvrE
LSAAGVPGVFKAPADGSAPTPADVAVGDPFAAPFGIAISTDGTKLFIADPGADVGSDKGAILTVSSSGGTPTALAGTQDAVPRNLEVAQEEGKDVVYFTGTDKSDGLPGVFSVPATGGTATAVLKGGPFRDPSGIAIAKDGTIYVADTIASADGGANIIAIAGGNAQVIVSGIRVGYPCGIALTTSDTVLFVSALDPSTLTDIVIKVDLATKEPTTLAPQTISAFSEAAGLHRAKNADVFGWADSSAGPSGGKVFVVK